jgi:hypothetical protein
MRSTLPRHPHARAVLAVVSLLAAGSCLAGRPLIVDDANVNDIGAGHIEAWIAHEAGASNTWTVAPAYGITDGVEVAAALSRDHSNQITSSAMQVKFRVTASRKDSCNFGAVMGLAHANAGGGNAPYLNGIFTCNIEGGAMHLNLGATLPTEGGTLHTWGMAYEREFGALTAHVEYFGEQQSPSTLQFGLRSEVLKNIQLDGTVGRAGGESIYSLGMKFMF